MPGHVHPPRVGPDFVVVTPPVRQHQARLPHRAEQRLVQALVPQLAIETLHKDILLRLTGGNVVPANATVLRPYQLN